MKEVLPVSSIYGKLTTDALAWTLWPFPVWPLGGSLQHNTTYMVDMMTKITVNISNRRRLQVEIHLSSVHLHEIAEVQVKQRKSTRCSNNQDPYKFEYRDGD